MANAPPRSIPVLNLDDCVLWEDKEEDKQTALVGKMEPTESALVVPVDVKGGNDQYGCDRLKSFIITHRIELLVWKSDRDNALLAKIAKVVDALRCDGFQVALEPSPIGESQSNGIASRPLTICCEPCVQHCRAD